ncbi:MAG TPA: outer membrane beta-barrel protein [Acidobacteriota bacterium]|nr:outer membrane beta-barrel protein [Acidobacteriota bacterium]
MKRQMTWVAAAVLLAAWASTAGATGWGIGGFGGISIPIVQDDAEQGTIYGAQLRLSVGGLLGIEPNVMYFRNGDWELDAVPGEVYDGSKFYAIGVNVILGSAGPPTGFRMFGLAGGKYYNEDNDYRDFSSSKLGWNAGVGLEIGLGTVGVEARAEGNIMPLDGGGSRKWVHLRAGLNYYFGIR